MPNVVQCSQCFLYYDGLKYQACPYCKKRERSEKRDDSIPAYVDEYYQQQRSRDAACTVAKDSLQEAAVKEYVDNRVRAPIAYVSKAAASDEFAEEKADFDVQERRAEPDAGFSGAYAQKTNKEDKEDEALEQKFGSGESEAEQLAHALEQSGRTVGKFFSDERGESVSPVVGWLVCLKGKCFGQSFELRNGKNKIGRASNMEVKLNEPSVSRTCVASIIFDSKERTFSIVPGESSSLCYLLGEAIYERKKLNGFEKLEFGDSGQNEFLFVPLCGANFTWESEH